MTVQSRIARLERQAPPPPAPPVDVERRHGRIMALCRGETLPDDDPPTDSELRTVKILHIMAEAKAALDRGDFDDES